MDEAKSEAVQSKVLQRGFDFRRIKKFSVLHSRPWVRMAVWHSFGGTQHLPETSRLPIAVVLVLLAGNMLLVDVGGELDSVVRPVIFALTKSLCKQSKPIVIELIDDIH